MTNALHNLGRMAAATVLLGLLACSCMAKEWVVGQIGPFTVLPVPDAVQLGEGAQAFFSMVNERGGIHGAKVEFFQLDDTYSPERFVERFREAAKRRPLVLLSPLGSASVKRMLDTKLLDEVDTVVLNVVPGAEALRKPGHERLFHIRTSDRQQIEKIIRHVDTLGHRKVGLIYQDIPMGSSGSAVAAQAATQTRRMQLQAVSSRPEGGALSKAAVSLRDAQSVIVIGSPKFSADAIAALHNAGMHPPVFAMSYLLPADLVRTAGPSGARGVGIAQTMPNPMGVVLPLQREFQAAMRKHHPRLSEYSVFHLEGYICAKIFCADLITMHAPFALRRWLCEGRKASSLRC
jgi:branched-chain amino acid transport system substrate-binding protein